SGVVRERGIHEIRSSRRSGLFTECLVEDRCDPKIERLRSQVRSTRGVELPGSKLGFQVVCLCNPVFHQDLTDNRDDVGCFLLIEARGEAPELCQFVSRVEPENL